MVEPGPAVPHDIVSRSVVEQLAGEPAPVAVRSTVVVLVKHGAMDG